jgi:hypothetical protein
MSRAAAALFLTLAPLGFGLLALALGMDANWDLRNYHYYNAYALLAGREGFDLLAAQANTFFNPILDIPFYLAANAWPARIVGFLLGAVQGLNLVPLYGIANAALGIARPETRRLAAAGLALFDMVGAGNLSELGTTFGDNVVTLGPLCALWLVLTHFEPIARGELRTAWCTLVGAGFLAGVAAGLKQPETTYALGLCLAFFAVPVTGARRLSLALLFGVGVLLGFAASDGFWLWHLWRAYGNPLMPFENQIFRSPWALPEAYRQYFNLSTGFWTRAFFPFAYFLDPKLTSEATFVDLRLLLCLIALPAATAVFLWRTDRGVTAPARTRYLLAALALSYLAWVWLFCVYRYFIAGEMLAPLALVLALGLVPLDGRARRWLLAGLFLLIAVTTRPADWIRVPWSETWVSADVPALAEPGRTLVLITGHEPLSYLIPSFPPAVRFLRIHSGFTNPTETGVRFNGEMERIVAAHRGPMYVLFNPNETKFAEKYLPYYRLAIERAGCRTVPSNIGYVPYLLCPLARTG